MVVHVDVTHDSLWLNERRLPQTVAACTELLGRPSKRSVLWGMTILTYYELGLRLFSVDGQVVGMMEVHIASDDIGSYRGSLTLGGIQVTNATTERELIASSIPFEKVECGQWRFKHDYFFIVFKTKPTTGASGPGSRTRFITSLTASCGQSRTRRST